MCSTGTVVGHAASLTITKFHTQKTPLRLTPDLKNRSTEKLTWTLGSGRIPQACTGHDPPAWADCNRCNKVQSSCRLARLQSRQAGLETLRRCLMYSL